MHRSDIVQAFFQHRRIGLPLAIIATLVVSCSSKTNSRLEGKPSSRFGQPTVYLDGERIAVLSAKSLPDSLPIRWVTLTDGREVRRHSFPEYFEALGIALGEIEALEMRGGRHRIARVRGPLLSRHRDDFLFAFTQGDRGKVRCIWPGNGFTSSAIDMVKEIHLKTL